MKADNEAAPQLQQDIGLLPDFCDVRNVALVVAVTEVFALVLALATPADRVNFWDHFFLVSLLMQWIVLLDCAVLCRLRGRLNDYPLWTAASLCFVLMMAVSLLVALGMQQLNMLLALDAGAAALGPEFVARVMLISAILAISLLHYFYIQYQWRSQLHSQARAEIQALRARIRPHFLFNSMNTIASLIGFRPDDAEKAIEDLSELFRASLMESNTHSLGDEIGITQAYLDIEQLRLGERLKITWDVDNSLIDEEIPSLCLQPLAENAIYHGIEPLPGGGTIDIAVRCERDQLVLQVSNPLSDASAMPHKKGNRMAQQNIRQRLELAYGNRAEFHTNETKHSYSVTLRIPLERVL